MVTAVNAARRRRRRRWQRQASRAEPRADSLAREAPIRIARDQRVVHDSWFVLPMTTLWPRDPASTMSIAADGRNVWRKHLR